MAKHHFPTLLQPLQTDSLLSSLQNQHNPSVLLVITSKDLACSHLDQIILKIKWKNKGLDNAIVHLPGLSYQVAFCFSTNKNIRSLWVSTATSICHNLQTLANNVKARQPSLQRLISICRPFLLNNRQTTQHLQHLNLTKKQGNECMPMLVRTNRTTLVL